MPYFILILFFILLFISHYLIYLFFITAFRIKGRKIKLYLSLILGILSIGFIASAIIVHIWPNFFTEFLYIITGIWYGFITNLSLAIGLFLFLVIIFRVLKYNFNKILFSRIFLSLAVLFTLFGVYSAFFPKIKNIEVSIKDLPSSWENKTIVHISDVHLGKALGVKFFNRVNKKIEEINPEIVLITGDLFDGMDGNLDIFIEALNNIKAKEGVYYVTGNHEIYIGLEEAISTLKKTNINILDDEVALVKGLQIIGVSYPTLEKNILEDKNFSFLKPSILLFHSPTDIGVKQVIHRDFYFSPDINFNTAISLGVDLQLSGHTHKGQIFPFNFLTNMLFTGYDYGLNTIDDFSIFTSSGTGFWGPAMRTGSRSEIVEIKLKKK